MVCIFWESFNAQVSRSLGQICAKKKWQSCSMKCQIVCITLLACILHYRVTITWLWRARGGMFPAFNMTYGNGGVSSLFFPVKALHPAFYDFTFITGCESHGMRSHWPKQLRLWELVLIKKIKKYLIIWLIKVNSGMCKEAARSKCLTSGMKSSVFSK